MDSRAVPSVLMRGCVAWLALLCRHWLIVAGYQRERVLGDHGPSRSRRAACPSRSCSARPPDDRCTLQQVQRDRWLGAWHGCVRQGRSRCAVAALAHAGCSSKPWRSPSRPGERTPSPSATASGAADRLLCPDSVRYMSVKSRPVERASVNCGDLCRRLERMGDAGLAESHRRSVRYMRMQHRSVRPPAREAEPGVRTVFTSRASGLRTAHSIRLSRRDKISNRRADLVVLPVVTGGRSRVRTWVG
jgi:hypothetical protein